MDISISSCSSIHLKFSHHISALWSEAHLVIYSSLWGRLSFSRILYSDVNYIYFNLINLSGLNFITSHVLLSNIEETMPFPQYFVVNSCNLDGNEYMCEKLIIYEWMNCNLCIIFVSCSLTYNFWPLGRISYHLDQTTSRLPKGPKLVFYI